MPQVLPDLAILPGVRGRAFALLLAVLAALVWMGSGVAEAGTRSMRCGSHLVRAGDTKVDVLKHCGKPQFREVVSGADERRVEEWYYERGTVRFPVLLTFRGLELVEIETITRP